MRTTIRLDAELLARAKAYAASHQQTLTYLIEEALRWRLAELQNYQAHPRKALPVSTAGGGTRPCVNLDDSATMVDLLDDHAASGQPSDHMR